MFHTLRIVLGDLQHVLLFIFRSISNAIFELGQPDPPVKFLDADARRRPGQRPSILVGQSGQNRQNVCATALGVSATSRMPLTHWYRDDVRRYAGMWVRQHLD